MATNAQVTDKSYFEMAVNGTFYNQNHTVASKYPAPVAFDVRNPAGRALQFHLTEWTINTALEANYDGKLPQNITYILEKLFNFNLNTTFFGTVIPQLIEKYGENKTVELSAILIDKPSYVVMKPGYVEGNGWLAVTGTVGGSEAFYGEFSNGKVVANVGTNSTGAVLGEINTLSIGTILASTFRTALPDVTAASL